MRKILAYGINMQNNLEPNHTFSFNYLGWKFNLHLYKKLILIVSRGYTESKVIKR